MKHFMTDLKNVEAGSNVVIEVGGGHNVNVMIMTYDNYAMFKKGYRYRFYGGIALKNRIKIPVPYTNNWVAVVFAYPFGYVQSCNVEIEKEQNQIETVAENNNKSENVQISIVEKANDDIDESQNEYMQEFYMTINRFEKDVRKFISEALKEAYGNDEYINKGIGRTILDGAEERLESEKSINIQLKEDISIIDYVDFPQLKEIIISKKNWGKVFENLFIDKSSVIYLYETITKFRRPTAHNRDIDESELARLKIYINDWEANIKTNK